MVAARILPASGHRLKTFTNVAQRTRSSPSRSFPSVIFFFTISGVLYISNFFLQLV